MLLMLLFFDHLIKKQEEECAPGTHEENNDVHVPI
jgi:hypothetical protein